MASSGMTMPPNQTTPNPESDQTPAGRRGNRRRGKSSRAAGAAIIAGGIAGPPRATPGGAGRGGRRN